MKTIKVEDLKAHINQRLATDESINNEPRQELIILLEHFLHRSGNYHGFQYLGQNEVPEGHKPGIHWEPELFDNPDTRFKDTDLTRVRYY